MPPKLWTKENPGYVKIDESIIEKLAVGIAGVALKYYDK